ncbi:MAG: amidohydrolase family protein, partial [Candidatus Nanopelagicales bacterium]
RIPLATALAAYTAGSAWANGQEETTGHLREGALADLALLDRDPFDGPSEQIADARVVQTFIEGQQAFTVL